MTVDFFPRRCAISLVANTNEYLATFLMKNRYGLLKRAIMRNPDLYRGYVAKCNRKNREKRKAASRAFYEANKEKLIKRQSEWARQNSKKVYQSRRERRAWLKLNDPETHKARIEASNKNSRIKWAARYAKICGNPARKLRHKLSARLCQALSLNRGGTKKATKCAGTASLIGCTMEFLKARLESQFKPGMTWDNYGRKGWQVDHIIPCASFDFSDPEQQRKCFHFSNLQPLWWHENLSKSDKIAA